MEVGRTGLAVFPHSGRQGRDPVNDRPSPREDLTSTQPTADVDTLDDSCEAGLIFYC